MDYIVYDDADDEERSKSLVILTPIQQQLSVVISRIIELSTEALHSSIRNFLEQTGIFADLGVVELEGLRGCYSSFGEFIKRMEDLFHQWTRSWKSKDVDNALSFLWERFKTLFSNAQLPSNGVSPEDSAPVSDFSNDNWSRKAVLSRRRKEGNIPLPDRPSLPDLSSVMRPDYPIGDSFDYDDFQPLIPNLKQPRQCSSMGNGLLVSCEVIAKPSALLTTPCSESLERQSKSTQSDDVCRLGSQRLSDNVARSMLSKAFALEIASAGFVGVQMHAIDVIVDVAIEHIQQWARLLKEDSLELNLDRFEDGLTKRILDFIRDRKDSLANPNVGLNIQSNHSNESDAKRPRLY